MKLSQLIKNYRKEKDLTQTELANLLYVSKQAISKWENDKSLPDTAMYPQLANLLGVSVDYLMGNEKIEVIQKDKEEIKSNKNKLIINITLISILTLLLILFSCIYLIDSHKIKELNKEKDLNTALKETEETLNVFLPEVSIYEYNDFTSWQPYNDATYPNNMYYFIFKDQLMAIDDTWLHVFPKELVMYIPLSVREYLNTCDNFKLVNKTTGQINEAPLKNDSNNSNELIYFEELSLYCLQKVNKRLIIINFKVEKKVNEENN